MAGTKKNAANFKKTECPVSRGEFKNNAPNIKVSINGVEYTLSGREFSTGSLGYNLSDKGQIVVGNKGCKVQIGVNITLVGSKELPTEGEGAVEERKAA